jgi:hypothetical protein
LAEEELMADYSVKLTPAATLLLQKIILLPLPIQEAI